MSLIAFNNLPDEARLWIFNTDMPLDDQQIAQADTALGRFLEQWTAHRIDVPSGFEIREKRFILIGADTRTTGTAGCSIDSMMAFMRSLQQELGVTIIDAPDVCYRDETGVQCVSRNRFTELSTAEEVTTDTTVFDNTVTSVRDLREGHWEKPARASWHGRAFDLKEAEVKAD
jgi:hypothetical protein